MSDADERTTVQQEEIREELIVVDPWRYMLGMACVLLGTIGPLILATGILILLPAARDSGNEAWRINMIMLGIQTGMTSLPWYFAGRRLLQRVKSRPPAFLRNFILLTIPIQLLILIIIQPVHAAVDEPGSDEFIKFVSIAMQVQAVLAVGIGFMLNAIWRKQPVK